MSRGFTSGMKTSARGDWRTPRPLYARLTVDRYDVSSRHGGQFDALADPWPQPWFCNPPYGRQIGEWTRRMVGGRGVALLPARTDTVWFHRDVLRHARLVFIKGRLHFDGQKGAAPFPSLLAYYGGEV